MKNFPGLLMCKMNTTKQLWKEKRKDRRKKDPILSLLNYNYESMHITLLQFILAFYELRNPFRMIFLKFFQCQSAFCPCDKIPEISQKKERLIIGHDYRSFSPWLIYSVLGLWETMHYGEIAEQRKLFISWQPGSEERCTGGSRVSINPSRAHPNDVTYFH